jgi:phosphatidylglycerol---prolipoprotein diacylglyceryl transferase
VLKVGAGPLAWEILPRIHLGPLAVSPHGIGIALGYLIGAQFGIRRLRRSDGPDESDFWNGLFYALIGAVVGARVGYVLGHLSEVTDSGADPLGVFKVWEGGISLLGGITGGILAAVPYVHKKRMGFWRCMDIAAPGLALGIFIGRFGDLVIGDHLGKPTDFALGWRCLGEAGGGPPQSAAMYRDAAARGSPPSLGCFDITLHQTALYDLVSTLLLLVLLVGLGKRAHRSGFLALVFVVWYGSMRVVTDFLRVDKRYLGLTGSQILALAAVLTAAVFLVRWRGAPPRWADPPPAEGATTAQSDGNAEKPADSRLSDYSP